MLLPAGFFGCLYDLARDDGAVCFCNLELFHLTANNLLNLVLQAESHFGNVGGLEGGFNQVVAVGGEN